MKIKTQFFLTTVIFTIILAIVAVTVVILSERIDTANRQRGIARQLQQDANELGYLANDYLLYGESQQVGRWEAKLASFSRNLANLDPGTAEQQALVGSIAANRERLRSVFAEAQAASVSASQSEFDPTVLRVYWSRLAVQNQGLIFDASRLAQTFRDEANGLIDIRAAIMYVALGVFGAFILANFIFSNRRVLRSIYVLQKGTREIGSGNLDYTIEVTQNDELGELSRAFNQMTANLKSVTASKADLEREIAERKRAEAEVVHLASFPELNPSPVLELDASGRVRYLNPAAKTAFPDIIAQGTKHPLLQGWKELAAVPSDKRSHPVTKDIRIGDSWFLTTMVYVPQDGGFRIYTRDITKRRKAEDELRQRTAQLEVANKELESFSYSVSHDLRTPLRSIEGFSQALLEDYAGTLDDTARDYLNRIQNSSQAMAQLIDDILKLARITRSEMRFDRVNLAEMAAAITADMRNGEPDREVEVTIERGLKAKGDANLLRVALENLIQNAWKFTRKNPRPRIQIGVTEREGRKAFFVKDNGAGFDMAYVGKLFGPFQRLHRADEFSGTGIGLAIVQRIILRHGGEVWAEGEVGKGATFYFTLPEADSVS